MKLRRWIPLLCVGIACGPQREPKDFSEEYASALCDSIATCSCAPRFDSDAACVTEYASRLDEFLDGPYEFDRSCFDDGLELLAADPCDPLDSAPQMRCVTFAGHGRAGASCASYGSYVEPFIVRDCDEASTSGCIEGVCGGVGVSTAAKNAGDPCLATEFSSCHAQDLYCSPTDATCHPRGLLGEPCEAAIFSCDTGLVCAASGGDGMGTCMEPAGLGEPCDPLDWQACLGTDDPSQTVVCDAAQGVCVVGPPLCDDLNYTPNWWP